MVLDDAGRACPSRRVSFLGKCQVIPPVDFGSEDVVEDYFSRKASSSSSQHDKSKLKGKLHLFRSRKTRSWSNGANDDNQLGAHVARRTMQPLVTPPPMPSPRSESAPLIRPSLSPSLPISYDGTANRLRQKLVSPPPPSPDDPSSPTVSRRPELKTISTSSEQSIASSNSTQPPNESSEATPSLSPVALAKPLARPVAVRKPLTFGFDQEDEQNERAKQAPTLHIPPIVYISRPSRKEQQTTVGSQSRTEDGELSKPTVLDWKDEGSTSSLSSDDEREDVDDEDSFEEEDLHGQCTCVDCEQKIAAALSPTYQPQWTRAARRKYLADRKDAQNEQSRKAVRPPIWLTTEESETAAAASASLGTADGRDKVREIQADEIDSKQGVSKKEYVTTQKGRQGSVELLPSDEQHLVMDNDDSLRREVDEEVHLREAESALKKTRSEMRRLSSDVGSGLRVGGGGARAMMRQLEEAEQAERRALIERSRSPRHESEKGKEESRPMGAIPDLPVKPFTPPPRIASPTVVEQKKTIPTMSVEKPSRTPSPLRRALSLVASSGGTEPAPTSTGASRKASIASVKNQSEGSSPKDDAVAAARLPSPSLLIQRELTLGIPVQSNTASVSKARQSSHGSPLPNLEAKATTPVTRTPSPRLTSPDGSLSRLTDISEVPAKGEKLNGTLPRKPGARSRSVDQTQHRRSSEDSSRSRKGVEQRTDEGYERPAQGASSLRRANTTGSRTQHGMGQYGSSPLSSSTMTTANGYGHSLTPALVEARLDKAKAKAKSSFKDLVARIKG